VAAPTRCWPACCPTCDDAGDVKTVE
jgi:hypothetical protein